MLLFEGGVLTQFSFSSHFHTFQKVTTDDDQPASFMPCPSFPPFPPSPGAAEMQVRRLQAPKSAPLQPLPTVHRQDGPPLPVGEQLRGHREPEALLAFLLLHLRAVRVSTNYFFCFRPAMLSSLFFGGGEGVLGRTDCGMHTSWSLSLSLSVPNAFLRNIC